MLGNDGQSLFEVKKIFRRGKVWFEGKDLVLNKKYIINYENWRIGVPELFISSDKFKMKIDKEMEDWSNFIINDEVIARWLAVYNEQSDMFSVKSGSMGRSTGTGPGVLYRHCAGDTIHRGIGE